MARARIIFSRNAKKRGISALIGRLRISVFVHSGTQVGSLTWSLFVVRVRLLRAFRQIPAGNADFHFPLERRSYQADAGDAGCKYGTRLGGARVWRPRAVAAPVCARAENFVLEHAPNFMVLY